MRQQDNYPISLADDGSYGLNIYYGQPPATDDDFNNVKMLLQANYSWLRDNSSDNNMFWVLLRTAIKKAGMSGKRLMDATMHCIMHVEYFKIKDIVEYNKRIKTLSLDTVSMLPEGHNPVAQVFMPDGTFALVWEEEAKACGMEYKHYETPSEREARINAQFTPEEREENLKRFDALLNKIAKHSTINKTSKQ